MTRRRAIGAFGEARYEPVPLRMLSMWALEGAGLQEEMLKLAKEIYG